MKILHVSKSTNFHYGNMQYHADPISSELFFNLSVSVAPHIADFLMNNTKRNTANARNYNKIFDKYKFRNLGN